MATRVTRKDSLQEGLNLPSLVDLPVVKQDEYVATGRMSTAGNPFIELLGRHILDSSMLKLKCTQALPIAPPGGSDLIENPVLMALELSYLYKVPYPTPNLIRLHQRVLEVIATGYQERNPLNHAEAARVVHMLQTRRTEEIRAVVESSPGANAPSIMVMGASGMGKTFGLKYVLKLLPTAVRHLDYHGHVMNHVQVPHLYVQCPPTGTLKALLLNILLQLDLRLGTRYFHKWLFSNFSTDVLLVNVGLILYNHGLGAIVMDELQHLKVRGYAETEMLLNFFVSLMNFLQIPLISVGTYAALDLLSQTMRDARRLCASGTLDFCRYGAQEATTRALQNYYFSFLPGLEFRPLTQAFHENAYGIHQGFHFLFPNLVHRCGVETSYRGLKYVTDEVLNYYKDVELKPIRKALDAVASGDPDRIAQYDDLMSPDAIKAMRNYQDRKARERIHGKTRTGSLGPASAGISGRSSGLGDTVPEFPHEELTEEEIRYQCLASKMMFGDSDLYPALRAHNLLAPGVIYGHPLQGTR